MARNFRSTCPQLQNYAYSESYNGYGVQNDQHDEDCLYLNIWTPQTARQNGNHSVLVIITGEEQSFDWSQNRPSGLNLASEGIIVVTIQSRVNIFGWLTLRNTDAPGNLGLRDQRMAFDWIVENIERFGGNTNSITLLGHGTSGATNAMLHLVNDATAKMFQHVILMSGTIFSTYSFQTANYTCLSCRKLEDPSQKIVKKLACESPQTKHTLECLRQKSVSDLLKAFDSVYQVS